MWACRLLAERDSERIVYARDSRGIRGLGDAEGLSVPRLAHRNAVRDGGQVAHGGASLVPVDEWRTESGRSARATRPCGPGSAASRSPPLKVSQVRMGG
jgi:hypothetical protein